jgi:hypothetical protein
MKRLASIIAALGLLATSASSAAAADYAASPIQAPITTITENGHSVNLAQVDYIYYSSLGLDNQYTTKLDNGTRAEIWKIQGSIGQCLDVTMHSDELDSFVGLYLVDPRTGDANKIDEDDDMGGGRSGLDARVRDYLPTTGAYYVVAASAGRTESGRYSLDIASCAY